MASENSSQVTPAPAPQPGDNSSSADLPSPAAEKTSASFRESKISVAVDVSGSTYGPTLEAEKRAIKSVCSLLPRSMHENITILPWNDESERPRPVSELDTLESSGGTDPNVVLEDPECRLVLQGSGFWFLMTDGIIEDWVVRKFARSLTDYGMHGKACIISVFGERVTKPSDCNISVGLSVFAVSPHVAFLYTDVEFNITYVLSTKGCFSTLLPQGKRNPKLDYDTSWDDLPQASYENLTRVSVPAAQHLGRDEVALQGNTCVNIPALLSQETVDEDLMRKIMLNEDNIKTIAITSKLRGEADKLSKWLDKMDAKLDKDRQTDDFTARTESKLLKNVEAKLSLVDRSQPPHLEHRSKTPEFQLPPQLKKKIRHSSGLMRELSTTSDFSNPEHSISCLELDDITLQLPETEEYLIGMDDITFGCSGFNLANTGFLRPNKSSEQFSGLCSRCGRSRVVLALLLRVPPHSTVTEHFPLAGSLSKLVYPLTVGNYPETDIIANAIACDDCTAEMAKAGSTSPKEAITAVLPLVSYSKNQDAWLQTLNIATSRRFSRFDLPLVFLAILFTKLERLVSNPGTLSDLQDALHWECKMIQSEVVLQADSAPTTNQFGVGLVHEVLLRNFCDGLATDKFPLLLSYPLDGFIVANAALSNSRHSMVLTQEKRKTIAFLRFLYHLLESYQQYGKENGEIQLHAAKTLILLMDDPSGPRSLFKWNSLRQYSFYFKKVEEFRSHLREMVSLNRYRLSLTVTDLLDTPLLTTTSLADFRRLGPLFSWIEREAGHAIAVFLHYLMRLDVGECPPEVLFRKLRERQEIKEALADSGALSARSVERLIKPLPPLE